MRSGGKTLRISAKLKPYGPAKSRGAKLSLIVERGTVSGDPEPWSIRSFKFAGPRGLRINTGAFRHCRVSTYFQSPTAGACPAASRVGTGSATIDLRPATPQLLQVPATIYNATSDLDVDLRPRPKALPGVLLDLSVTGYRFDVLRSNTFFGAQPEPLSQGPPGFGVARVELRIGGVTRRGVPYVQLPARCPSTGSWRFTATDRSWGGPTVKATHDIRCGR